MKATQKEIELALGVLTTFPRRILAVTKALTDAQLRIRPDKNEWSPVEIFAHLRASVDVWGKSIEEMFAKKNPTLPCIHPNDYLKKTDYVQIPFHESLRAYSAQREKLLGLLKSLKFEDWEKSASIKGRTHTIFTQTRRMAKHEADHCGQLETMLGKG